MIYDYYGFPDAAYDIQYPLSGDPKLAERIYQLLNANGIEARLDQRRGFDHGVFVPLKLMYPDANIPCVQLSLLNTLDPETHIKIGQALSELRKENVLIIGSGFSFHNLRDFFTEVNAEADKKNEAFENWLVETCTDADVSGNQREKNLINWKLAPYATYCHPREEHLLPLHVCYGIANTSAELVFHDKVSGKLTCAFLW